MVKSSKLADYIGDDRPCFVIAEAGVNHNGDLDMARDLVDAAAEAGADAVKFQTFAAKRLVAPRAQKAEYQKKTGSEEGQLEMLKRLELGLEAHVELQSHARDRGIVFLSSPFDEASVDSLIDAGVPMLKLGSGELDNLPLLRHAAGTGLPLVLSTGMSHLSEVDEAVRWVRRHGCEELAVMHCVSLYPTPRELPNVRAMNTLIELLPDVPIGFSDHTTGLVASVVAVARGARLIEKHLTLDRTLPGPDHAASLAPAEFGQMMEMIREAEDALGDGVKRPQPGEEEMRKIARRSLHVVRDLSEGTAIEVGDIAVLRPSDGLSPALYDDAIGATTLRPLRAGEPLRYGDFRVRGRDG